MNENNQAIEAPSFWEAFTFWLKLGFISFGGPAGQIAVMHQELVERRRWISEKRFLHALNYCMLLPGPEAQQLATYIGWLMHRTAGGLVAGILFILPSLFILIGLSCLYVSFGNTTLIAGLFYGIKPAIVAIVFQAAYRIGSRTLKHRLLWVVAVLAFLAIFIFDAPFPLIVLFAGITGWVGSNKFPGIFIAKSTHQANDHNDGAAWINDNTPTPDHAKFSWIRFFKVVAIGKLLWIIPIGLLIVNVGWKHTLTQMAWFFTKAALLTFGGAYAVLPYVYQGAVTHFEWLTSAQMMDGLALGETTPGPLIMVVTFVGFMGGYVKELFGADHLLLGATVAAVVVTWFTFLPSFVFILLGGPIIEGTHNKLNFTAPLTAITAAVVGVIVNLAMFFAYHVLWPNGVRVQLDWIATFAAIALFKYKLNIIYVLAICALLGLMKTLLY